MGGICNLEMSCYWQRDLELVVIGLLTTPVMLPGKPKLHHTGNVTRQAKTPPMLNMLINSTTPVMLQGKSKLHHTGNVTRQAKTPPMQNMLINWWKKWWKNGGKITQLSSLSKSKDTVIIQMTHSVKYYLSKSSPPDQRQ
jgi:hypothetical protein